jgi:adenylate kinase
MMKFFLTLLIFMANLQATQSQVVILLGPPGAGKGSQAKFIQEKMDLPHISTGDLFRENIKQGTELGKKAKAYIDAGELSPDELVFDMLFDRVAKADCKKGYILDGFPRNLAQAEVLQKRLSSDHDVIALNLSVPDSVIVERITKREICKSCQTPYHQVFSPPKETGKCDECGGELYQRSDDTKEVVESRLKVYHEQTAPLIAFYESKGNLQTVDSNRSKQEITKEILEKLTPAPAVK